jgi:hypothetical protein
VDTIHIYVCIILTSKTRTICIQKSYKLKDSILKVLEMNRLKSQHLVDQHCHIRLINSSRLLLIILFECIMIHFDTFIQWTYAFKIILSFLAFNSNRIAVVLSKIHSYWKFYSNLKLKEFFSYHSKLKHTKYFMKVNKAKGSRNTSHLSWKIHSFRRVLIIIIEGIITNTRSVKR